MINHISVVYFARFAVNVFINELLELVLTLLQIFWYYCSLLNDLHKILDINLVLPI